MYGQLNAIGRGGDLLARAPRTHPGGIRVASKQQPASGTYRGRRRLPKLPTRRYLAVVTTAFLAAAVVALGAGAIMPDSGARETRTTTRRSWP